MNKISFKIGLLFFISIFLLETILMFFLHNNIIHSRVDEELAALQTRGNNHREILEASYRQDTIHHIALMESRTDTQVVVTDQAGDIIMSSNTVTPAMRKVIHSTPEKVAHEGEILEDDWKNKTYISSVSPIVMDKQNTGYVYMFKNTQKVKELIAGLNEHFLLAGLLSLFFIIFIIFILSKFVTYPLVKMNETTRRISNGDYSISLPKMGKDEIGELARSINILATDLEHLKNERNEFLASISHELRTPLTYIKGYAEIARRNETAKEDQDHYLNIIVEEATKLSNLIKELFHLAKMDENSFSIQKESIELTPYLQNICDKVKPAFTESQMKVIFSGEKNITAKIDPVRFEQVILNLLDNARKYSEPHTTTTLKSELKDGKIHIYVRDEGKGIPEKDLPRIFDRFYRVDKSRARALGGTGLGLSIVKELVEAHGGTIMASSTMNEGTVFEIIL